MKFSAIFLTTSLLFTLVACNGEGLQGDPTVDDSDQTDPDITQPVTPVEPQEPTEPAVPTVPPTTPSDGVPAAAKTLKFNIKYVNFSAAQKTKYEKAVNVIRKVVASPSFMNSVKNHKYGGKLTYVDNGGKTNAQIYQAMLDGSETLQATKNNAMDVEVELYYANTSTVGYTYANSKRIWVNTKYFDSYTPAKVAGNLFHEWLHKLGFGHASSYSTSRDYSVPYAIGYMISSMGAKL